MLHYKERAMTSPWIAADSVTHWTMLLLTALAIAVIVLIGTNGLLY
jgi:hypothetical protein